MLSILATALMACGRSWRGQYGGSDSCGSPLFRCCRQTRRAGEVHAERDDWIRGAGLCHLLGQSGTGEGGREQSGVPVAEIPEVRAWLPVDLGACDVSLFQ